ncbi:MAG TPA: ferrochelatase [Acidobacteriota bacterium]|nr:ferrochelatase [Acidobacteriota bacterium]
MQKGVLLFNLGGPENLQDVRPFLYNLFSDPEIIRIKSDVLRKTLAWLIASMRQGKSRNLYRQIGGGSPLRKITENQAAALRDALRIKGENTGVYVGMRCWNPTIDEAVERILRDGITQLVLLPLFPQYSVTTTGSCLKYFQGIDEKRGLSARMEITTVTSWFDEPLYIEAMADLIREGLRGFSGGGEEKIHLLYTAHSIPLSYVEKGDPYLEQTKRSVELINALLGNVHPFTLAFQSKVGPVKWLGPSTRDALVRLGQAGNARVLAVPVSFVSDHIETLQEIDIQYKELAAQSGICEFRRADSLNVHPKFIAALSALSARGNEPRE